MSAYENWRRFAALFNGLDSAFGTGKGQWIKRPPRPDDWIDHLEGKGPGLGIAPLRPDSTVLFAAIDLDEPDFEAAREMQGYIPGTSFIERTRSGNVHLWVFFADPIPAWIPMGVLKEATLAAGKKHVEVFPKNHDFARVKLGNYINLPFHGNKRLVLDNFKADNERVMTVDQFIASAEDARQSAAEWQLKAKYLMIQDPALRESSGAEWGQQSTLHMCADYILSGEAGPIPDGHRQNVYFAVAKQLLNWSECSYDEALDMLRVFNDHQPEDAKVPDREIIRILDNAERGQYKSTGCDDPVVLPFTHPNCPIANPRS